MVFQFVDWSTFYFWVS